MGFGRRRAATRRIPSLALLLFKNTHTLSLSRVENGGGGGGRHNARKLCSLLLMLHNFLLGASWLPGEMRKPAEFSLLIYCEYVKLNIHFTLAAATMLCGLLIFYCLAARFALSSICNGLEFLLRISAVLYAEFTVRLSHLAWEAKAAICFAKNNGSYFHWKFQSG